MGKRPAAKVSHSRSKKTMKTKAKNKTSKAAKAMTASISMKAMKAATAMKAMKVMKAVKTVQRSSKKPTAMKVTEMKDQRTKPVSKKPSAAMKVKRSNSSSTAKAMKTMKAPKAMKAAGASKKNEGSGKVKRSNSSSTAKAMKTMKAPKAMKAASKKKKGNPKVAAGRWAKWRVYVGWKEKTVGRLKKQNLQINRRGRVVYKKMSDQAKDRMKNSKISTWYQSVKKAREVLKLVGFVPVGGKTAAGAALLKQTKMIYYEQVYNISQKATEAMLQLMRSPSPSSPAAPVSPELVELTSQPGTAGGQKALLSSPELTELSPRPAMPSPEAEKGEMESSRRKDEVEVLGGQEAA